MTVREPPAPGGLRRLLRLRESEGDPVRARFLVLDRERIQDLGDGRSAEDLISLAVSVTASGGSILLPFAQSLNRVPSKLAFEKVSPCYTCGTKLYERG